MEKETLNTNEAEKLYIPVIGSSLFLSVNDQNLKNVRARYGETHKIEAVFGTKVKMETLLDNQSVCWGDGKTYHFRLTKL